MSRLTRDGTAEPVSRDQTLRQARGHGNTILPVQLTTSRIGNLTRLIHTLLYLMTIHTRQGVALASTRRPHSQGPASLQAHCTGGVTGSEGQKGANGVGGGIGVGGGNGDGNGDVDGQGDGEGAGAGTGVEANKEAQDGNGDGSGDGAGTGTGTGTESRTVAEMGTGTTITGTRIELGRAEGRRKSARNRKIAVDAARETGETWVESEKNVEKKGLVQ